MHHNKTKSPFKKFPELKRFLPCFFDVPLKIVLETLGLSHHTLDPIRRSMGLKRWPYVEMSRGRFLMKDIPWYHEDVVAFRALMMSSADTEMQQAICRIAVRAEECWSSSIFRPHDEKKAQALQALAAADDAAQAPPDNENDKSQAPTPENANVWEEPASNPTTDLEFWEEIARLFSLHPSVTLEPLVPLVEEAVSDGSPDQL
jgi:hypothetical protein